MFHAIDFPRTLGTDDKIIWQDGKNVVVAVLTATRTSRLVETKRNSHVFQKRNVTDRQTERVTRIPVVLRS
jgi:hypothetical protein